MIKEQIISFDTAKLAKEKNFRVKTKKFYHLNNKIDGLPFKPFGGCVAAPTQSLLQRWLRDIHQTDITVITEWKPTGRSYRVGLSYVGKFAKIDIWFSRDQYEIPISYNSYEEALEVGLIEGLNKI